MILTCIDVVESTSMASRIGTQSDPPLTNGCEQGASGGGGGKGVKDRGVGKGIREEGDREKGE